MLQTRAVEHEPSRSSRLWKQIKPIALQGLVRTPAPPLETKQWRTGAGVTVLSADEDQVMLLT